MSKTIISLPEVTEDFVEDLLHLLASRDTGIQIHEASDFFATISPEGDANTPDSKTGFAPLADIAELPFRELLGEMAHAVEFVDLQNATYRVMAIEVALPTGGHVEASTDEYETQLGQVYATLRYLVRRSPVLQIRSSDLVLKRTWGAESGRLTNSLTILLYRCVRTK